MTNRIPFGSCSRWILFVLALQWVGLAHGDTATPCPGTRVIKTRHSYPLLVQRLESVIEKIAADAAAR